MLSLTSLITNDGIISTFICRCPTCGIMTVNDPRADQRLSSVRKKLFCCLLYRSVNSLMNALKGECLCLSEISIIVIELFTLLLFVYCCLLVYPLFYTVLFLFFVYLFIPFFDTGVVAIFLFIR